ELHREVSLAIESGEESVARDGIVIPARPETLNTISARLERMAVSDDDGEREIVDERGPIVLESKSNLRDLQWFADLRPRQVANRALPALVQTRLKPHQIACFEWQQEAWKAGLPGVLNADEQGLGKTL